MISDPNYNVHGQENQQAVEQTKPVSGCPLDRQALGNATWGLLHLIGIYYPDKPSSQYQVKSKTFIEALALMYPCVSIVLAISSRRLPNLRHEWNLPQLFDVAVRTAQIVNRKLNKPVFVYTMKNLEERWI
ncbi:hypothetical protein PsorP6_000077 [Peronosclerospora sorghi]|uniref:Uncharacterized protein n=1 Tax=Peronosclerospora sorghi TaxID=230839 RepID=A0ACC0WU41_9STRA|nr:hypothetical protein PsorP6_000077 [Peronosclerospora sorghi]